MDGIGILSVNLFLDSFTHSFIHSLICAGGEELRGHRQREPRGRPGDWPAALSHRAAAGDRTDR